METRILPGTRGIEVSVVGMGCLPFGLMIDKAQVDAVVGASLDAGITLFAPPTSTAGEISVLASVGDVLGVDRGDLVVASVLLLQPWQGVILGLAEVLLGQIFEVIPVPAPSSDGPSRAGKVLHDFCVIGLQRDFVGV